MKQKCYHFDKANQNSSSCKTLSCDIVNSHRRRSFDQILQPGVAELQADDIVELFSF